MNKIITYRQQIILDIITSNTEAAISQIFAQLPEKVSTPTLNRDLAALVKMQYINKIGRGPATKYQIAPSYRPIGMISAKSSHKELYEQ